MSLIRVSNLTFTYEGSYHTIFEHVSFQIDTDWKLGFIGRNGKGKTTFLKILAENLEYTGTISAAVKFDYYPFSIEHSTWNTIDVIGQMYPDYEYWQLKRELFYLEVEEEVLYRSFQTLSKGEQTKIMLAVLFLKEHYFLLIDEPTNHLDARGREIVSSYLHTKKGFILVSHDRTFLDKCTNHILSINKADIVVQKGNFSAWYENKQKSDAFELAEDEKLKKDIARLSLAAKQSADWADKVESKKIGLNPIKDEKNIDSRAYVAEKSRRLQQRRKNLENRQQSAIEEKSNLRKNIETIESLKLHPLFFHKERLVSLENISIKYNDKIVCESVSFTLHKGQRIGVQGRNGCGKSSILKLILGELSNSSGLLEMDKNLIISYVPQDTAFLNGNLSDFAIDNKIEESLLKAILRKLDVTRVQFDKNMAEFSEGQKKKVLIAKSLCQKAHLYLWDEPLNYIDIYSRMQIEELLLYYKPTMIFVEHDAMFLQKVATEIITL